MTPETETSPAAKSTSHLWKKKHRALYFFDILYLNNTSYKSVTLQINDGKLSRSSIPEITEYFAGQPEENRVLCELGIGMNPNVADLCGYTVLDEKMAGTFHIAFGANEMFGGKNSASDHIDFVGMGKIETAL